MGAVVIVYIAIQAAVTLHEPAWYVSDVHPPAGCHFVRQRAWRTLLFPRNTSTLLCWSDGVLQVRP